MKRWMSRGGAFVATVLVSVAVISGCGTAKTQEIAPTAESAVATEAPQPAYTLTPMTSPTATATTAPSPTSAPTPTATPTTTPVPTSTPTATPTSTPTPSPTPTATSTPTPTASPTAGVDAIVAQNANLRSGPGTAYDVIGSVQTGAALDVLGRSLAGDWLKVRTEKGQQAWISSSLIVLHLKLSEVPVEKDIPTPRPVTPTRTVSKTPAPRAGDWWDTFLDQRGLPGQTLLNQTGQDTALGTIALFEAIYDESCQNRRVTNTEVVEAPRDVILEGDRIVNATWAERWSINRCGTIVRYRVGCVCQASGCWISVHLEP